MDVIYPVRFNESKLLQILLSYKQRTPAIFSGLVPVRRQYFEATQAVALWTDTGELGHFLIMDGDSGTRLWIKGVGRVFDEIASEILETLGIDDGREDPNNS